MKIKDLIYVTALLVLTFTSTFSQTVEWSRFTRYVDGRKFTFKVTAAELQKLPSWNPVTEDVPLSVRRAVEAARISLPRFLSTPEKWTLGGINFNSDDKGQMDLRNLFRL